MISAVHALFLEDQVYDPPLELVADRAGVSTRTILRHFGSKDGVVEAALTAAAEEVAADRRATPGDTETAIRLLVDHYEDTGERTMRLLAEAERNEAVRRATEVGIATHKAWVEEAFAPALAGLGARERQERMARIATVTDLYLWHLLRRRYRMGRPRVERVIRELVEHEQRRP